MSLIHNQLLTKFLFWAMAELILNFVGLDDLADYSEFLWEKHYHQAIKVEKCSLATSPVIQVFMPYSNNQPLA